MANLTRATNYTVPVNEIIDQIWIDGHQEEEDDPSEFTSFKDIMKDVNERIEYARSSIFQMDYPYYGDETDKKNLEQHILRDYYTRNICCDSVARWIIFLNSKMEDIMPRYKALWEAQVKLIASDYLNPYSINETLDRDVDITKNGTVKDTYDSETDDTSNTSSTNSGTDNTTTDTVNKFSNTPQALAETGKDYLTNMTKNTETDENTFSNSSSGNATNKTTQKDTTDTTTTNTEAKQDNYTKVTKGNLAKFNNAELVKAYDDMIMNIEKMISDELRDLFFLLY